jgi:acetyl-CoA synthetase
MRYKVVPPHVYRRVHRESVVDLEGFWVRQAMQLVWERTWSSVVEGRPPRVRWFVGGRLAPYRNIVGRHRGSSIWSKVAIVWETEDYRVEVYTYEDLDALVNRLACALRELGVGLGDWVVVYAPPTPRAVASILAAAKLGAAFETVFTGFGYGALARRLANRRPRAIVVSDGFLRRGRPVRTKEVVDRALDMLGWGERVKVLVLDEHGLDVSLIEGRDHLFSDVERRCRGARVEDAVVDAVHPFFGLHVAYEDTAKPVTYAVGGYLVQVYAVTKWIGLRPRDILFCTVWPGWITGVSHGIIGPLMVGSTVVLYDGSPDHPDWGRWLDIVERYAVTVLLTTGGALRMLSHQSPDLLSRYNMDTLKAILVTAEPLEPEVWEWAYRQLGTGRTAMIDSKPRGGTGRIPVVNLYIQSELATFVTGETVNYVFTWLAPGSAGTPIPGFDVDVVDEDGRSVRNRLGRLIIRKPWPSIPIGFPEDFEEAWSSEFYDTQDMGFMSDDMHVYAVGRNDAVMKVSGYRLSPGEVEEAVKRLPNVEDAVAAGAPDKLRFEAPFIVVQGDIDPGTVRKAVREWVGPIADPCCVALVDKLPPIPKRELRRRLKAHLWGFASDTLVAELLSKAKLHRLR